jgi:hypothetical protein
MTLKEAIEIVEKEMNDKVVDGIEYNNCYTFNVEKYIRNANSCCVFIDKKTKKVKTIHSIEPVIVNDKDMVSNNELVRFIYSEDIRREG